MKNMYKTFIMLGILAMTLFTGTMNFSVNAQDDNSTDTMESNSTAPIMQNATLAFAQEMNMTETEHTMENNITNEETHAMTSENEKEHGTDDKHGNATATTTTVRDSVTLLLEGKTLNAGGFIHIYDTTPYHIMNGHIAVNVPCNDESIPEVDVMIGIAPNLIKAELESVSSLSNPGDLCLYHVDLISTEDNRITDVAISNSGEDDVEFPEMSTVVLGVNEIMEGDHNEHHGEEHGSEEQPVEHTEETPEAHT